MKRAAPITTKIKVVPTMKSKKSSYPLAAYLPDLYLSEGLAMPLSLTVSFFGFILENTDLVCPPVTHNTRRHLGSREIRRTYFCLLVISVKKYFIKNKVVF